jgi:hypothetical protein
MKPIDVRQFTEQMMRRMRKIVEGGDHAIPMTFALTIHNRVECIGIVGMAGEREKNQVAQLLALLRERPDVWCVVFLANGYHKTLKEGEPITARLKDVPGRVECIAANVIERGVAPTGARWLYDRDPRGKPVFREIEWAAPDARLAGRFVPEGGPCSTN